MKAWMFSGLRADGRRSGLGIGWDRWSGAATSAAISRGWLVLHESGTYVKFTPAGAELFA